MVKTYFYICFHLLYGRSKQIITRPWELCQTDTLEVTQLANFGGLYFFTIKNNTSYTRNFIFISLLDILQYNIIEHLFFFLPEGLYGYLSSFSEPSDHPGF